MKIFQVIGSLPNKVIIILTGLCILACSLNAQQQEKQRLAEEQQMRSKAYKFDQEKKFSEAIATLRPLEIRYPKDYDLNLWLAWLYYRNENYQKAKIYYQKSLDIKKDSITAHLGLGWSCLKLGIIGEARREFTWVSLKDPDNVSSRQGAIEAHNQQKARDNRIRFSASSILSVSDYDNDHPTKDSSWSIEGHVHLTLYETLQAAFTYRNVYFKTTNSFIDDFEAREFFTSGGMIFSPFELNFHYVYIYDTSDYFEKVEAFGISTALTVDWGSFFVEASVSKYDRPDKVEVNRIEGAWWLPVFIDHITFSIAGAFQNADGDNYGTGYLIVTWFDQKSIAQSRWKLWLGAKYGEEYRPIYLQLTAIYNIIPNIQYGIWSGVSLKINEHFHANISGQYQRLEYDENNSFTSNSLSASLGITWTM